MKYNLFPNGRGGFEICAIGSDGVLGSLVLIVSPTLKTLSMLIATMQRGLLMLCGGGN